MSQPDEDLGGSFRVGDDVSVIDGTFAGQCGQVVGHHRKPNYPVVRLVVFGKSTDVWFHESQVRRIGERE